MTRLLLYFLGMFFIGNAYSQQRCVTFIDGEKIYFKDYLRESSLPKTPTFRDLTESNKVYLVENFRKVTNDGGWNYNIKTGEIHANLPYNFFEQGIDWENY